LSGPGHQAEVAAFGIQQQEAMVKGLQAALGQTDAEISHTQANVLDSMSRLSVEAIDKMADPIQRIKTRYSGLIEQARAHAQELAKAAQLAGDEAKAHALVTDQLEKQLGPLKAKEQAEIEAEQQRNRKGPTNAGGTAVFDAQIASFFDIANKYRGKSETGDKGVLESFFRAANENLDPEKTAWCAAFVNAVLAAGGVHGTGSLAARSFLTYGKDDTHSPQQGDIVVLRTGANQSHVGLLDSIDKAGNVRVLAGNTSNRVAEATYSKGQVLAIRRPPTPSEDASYQDKLAQEAQRQQSTFDEQLGKLQGEYLSALQKTVASADESAAAQLRVAQQQHDAEKTKIADSLAEGKYGEATSQLAQARARQLQSANDAALTEKQAQIAQAAFVKTSTQLQKAQDQRYQYQLDDLKFADQFARSSEEKRRLDLEIIDIEYQQKKTDLEALKARQIELLQFKDAAGTQADLDRLPQEKAQAQATAVHSTMSPFEQFLDSLPKTVGEINDSFQKAALDGLQQFNDGLANAIVSGKSLGDVFHQALTALLTDLIKLSEQLAESALFGNGISGAGAEGGFGGFLAKLLGIGSQAAGAFSFGAGGGYDAANANLVGGLASGTTYFPGGNTWVGEFGKEMVKLPKGSQVTPAGESRRLGAANDDAGRQVVVINNFELHSPVVTSDLLREMDQRADAAAQKGGELGLKNVIDAHQRTHGALFR
jgi:uncharacterized protein (TIGR02594 family)